MGNAWRAFKDEKLPNNYFRVQTTMLRILGIELMREETLLYTIYSRALLFTLVFTCLCTELYELWVQRTNLNVICVLTTYLITHLTGLFKTLILYNNRSKIGGIIKFFRKTPFAPNEARGGKEEERLVRNVIRKTEIQIMVYFSFIGGTIIGGAIKTVYERFAKDSSEWVFPYIPTISFMDLSFSPRYEIACVLQFLCIVLIAGVIASIYVLLSSIMAHISIQLKILANSFRDVRKRAKYLQARDTTDPKSEDFYLNVAFKSSYLHHLDVMELHQEMERLCSLMILSVFVTSVGLLCFTLYVTSMFPFGSIAFFQNFCLWGIIVCHTGMYCYWGNEVSLESENVAIAAAEADWPGAPRSITGGLIMVIGRTQKPLIITAGNFAPLSMTTFMGILKGSFSYFMILRQRHDQMLE